MTPQRYEIHTVIDITDSQCNDPKGNTKEYLQMQNLNSILQVLSMRAQPLNIHVSKNKTKEYFNNHDSWTLFFDCDINNAWSKDDNLVYFIEQDLNNIPIHAGLEETVTLAQEAFITDGMQVNTYVMIFN